MAKTMATTKRGSRFRFIGNIYAELRKVTWPTRPETIRLTLIVLAVVLVIGGFLFAVDYGFTHLVRSVFLRGG